MSFPSFKKIRTGDVNLDRIQDNISETLGPITKNTSLDSTQLLNISLVDGYVNRIPHMLGRTLVSYSVALQGNAVVWDTQKTNLSPKLYLDLWCSANVVVSILCW